MLNYVHCCHRVFGCGGKAGSELHALSHAYGDSCAAHVLHFGSRGRANYGRPWGSAAALGEEVLLCIPNLSDASYRLLGIVRYFAVWSGIGPDR